MVVVMFDGFQPRQPRNLTALLILIRGGLLKQLDLQALSVDNLPTLRRKLLVLCIIAVAACLAMGVGVELKC